LTSQSRFPLRPPQTSRRLLHEIPFFRAAIPRCISRSSYSCFIAGFPSQTQMPLPTIDNFFSPFLSGAVLLGRPKSSPLPMLAHMKTLGAFFQSLSFPAFFDHLLGTCSGPFFPSSKGPFSAGTPVRAFRHRRRMFPLSPVLPDTLSSFVSVAQP